jgi:short-subunit dehydrogenase
MRQARRGRIVVVTSNAVNTPHPLMSMYAASKWALEGWAEAVAMELAPFGVAVRVAQPGAHDTAFGGNVAHSFPPDSPYAPLIEAAMPNAYDLGRWSRDPAKATAPILRAILEEDAPFRTVIGDDTAAFAALKGVFPYEVRAWAVRALLGLPGPTREQRDETTLQQVMERITAAAARDNAEIATIAARLLSGAER